MLLRGSKLDVWRIAELTGFSNSTVFGRNFKNEHGCTPTEYRRKSNSIILIDACTPAAECPSTETLRAAGIGALNSDGALTLIADLEAIYLLRSELLLQPETRLPERDSLNKEGREKIEASVAWEALVPGEGACIASV
ncbi:MAG: AraC family transcriptional regulator [Proteobacteria bacterium]|nr:AraC family transcriptional regulator [Pseudomonadota bacterium]